MKLVVLRSALVTLFTFQSVVCPTAFCMDSNNQQQIVDKVKNGVVSVFSSNDHGSGFLIDENGLILTTSQVVGDDKDHLQVKFNSGKVLKALVLINDLEKDVAVLRVNMKAVADHFVLAVESKGNKAVASGEEVIAVGAPEDSKENSFSVGKVSKATDNMIVVDSAIESAVFGGPLLDLGGNVIGINTVSADSAINPSPGGVPISLIARTIEQAKEKVSRSQEPASDLLPDVPEVPFQIGELRKENVDLFQDRNHKEYNFDSNYFSVCVLTPPEGLNRLKTLEELKRKEKKGGEPAGQQEVEDSYAAEKYYDKAVVTLLVVPRPKYCKDSKGFYAARWALDITSWASIALGPAGLPISVAALAAHAVHDKRAVKRDFLQLSIVSDDDKPVSMPIASGRVPFTKTTMAITGCEYPELVDKSYIGMYTFDAHAFDTDKKLKLVVSAEGKKKATTFELPERVKKLIVEDFKPYWDYVAKLNSGKQTM